MVDTSTKIRPVFDKPVRLPRNFFRDLVTITNNPSIEFNKVYDDIIEVEDKDLQQLYEQLKNIINKKRIELISMRESVSTSKAEVANKLYENTVIEYINGLGSTREEAYKRGIEFLKEYAIIENGSKCKAEIQNMIEHLRAYPELYTENLVNKFLSLKSGSNDPREYIILHASFKKVIKKTYESKLVNSLNITQYSEPCFIGCDISDEENIRIITSNNAEFYEVGYVYDPSKLDYVYDDSNPSFRVFDDVDKLTSHVVLTDNQPSAVYAMTLGEKELSPRYTEARELAEYKNLPVIQMDITKFLNEENVVGYIKVLVDELLDQKFALADEKLRPSDLTSLKSYEKFRYFYSVFQSLKQKDYDKKDIIDEFEHCFSLLYDTSALDLERIVDYALNHYKSEDYIDKSVAEIRLALNNNPYFDFNIFRKKDKIDKNDVHNFIEYFKKYMDESNGNEEIKRVLETVYPGFSIDYIYLTRLNEEQIQAFVNYVNQQGSIDSWYLSQAIQPHHRITAQSLDEAEQLQSDSQNTEENQETINNQTENNDVEVLEEEHQLTAKEALRKLQEEDMKRRG